MHGLLSVVGVLVTLAFAPSATALSPASANACLDDIIFGDAKSEEQHGFSAERSEALQGGLRQPARRLLPLARESWEGGRLWFNLKVSPDQPNYFTVRFWGDDVGQNTLILYCQGKQIGYRHLGDIDILDHGCDEPIYNGRFFYNTTPLPLELTRGKTQLAFEIRSSGPIWGYGKNFAQYQKNMTRPTRGIYRAYTHTNGFFVPPPDELQGEAPRNPPVRQEPGVEVLEEVRKRVNSSLDGILRDRRRPGQMPIHFLARAYWVKETPAYQNPKTVEQVIRGLDDLFLRYRKNPKLAQADPGTPNPDWFGFGLAGDAIRLLGKQLEPFLDEEISDGQGGKIKRRAAWCEMLLASREWNRRNRRQYTNQSMIKDMNIYRANRGIAALNPVQALPENEALRYLYESIGVQPWLGSDTEHGSARPLGDDYWQLTDKGLTKELGFVGYYGEVLDWITQIYDSVRDPGQEGDPKIKAQLEKVARARAWFRYPALDAEGFRCMRAETVVGWRDVHFPGDVTYGQRPTWDASPIEMAAATLDPDAVGYAQQMLMDNQFFAMLKNQMRERGLRTTMALLNVAGDYERLKAQPPGPRRLPMSPGQPDVAWADEEDGVLAVKHGDEILYVSLYWRARYAVNFLARVHHLTPQFSRTAVVRQETEFEPSGMTYKRPDWVNMGFGNGGHRYPGNLHSAHAGEQLPIAKIPAGIPFKPGQENIHAGKGSFYSLRYGNYLVGMNTTTNQTFTLKVPAGLLSAPELMTGRTLSLKAPLKVTSHSTTVLYLGESLK